MTASVTRDHAEPIPLMVLSALADRICWRAGELPDGASIDIVNLLDREGLIEFSSCGGALSPWYSVCRRASRGSNGTLTNLSAIMSPGGMFRIRVTSLARDVLRVCRNLRDYDSATFTG